MTEFVVTMLVLGLLPVLIAAYRRHPAGGGITVLSLLLGWTVIGWIVALCWSLGAIPEDPEPAPAATTPPAPGSPGAQAAAGAPADDGPTRTCPYCAETIKAAAILCRYCGKESPAATL